jgi:hypothetical protein
MNLSIKYLMFADLTISFEVRKNLTEHTKCFDDSNQRNSIQNDLLMTGKGSFQLC